MEEQISVIRKRIGDKPKTEVQKFVGNGTAVAFDIAKDNAYDFVVTVGAVVTPSGDYTYDAEIQKLIFDTAPDSNEQFDVKYKYAAFTDDELEDILGLVDDDIDQATAEALRQVLGDQARMVTFTHGDRTVSMSDVFKNLSSLLDKYERKVTNAGANSGTGFSVGTREMNDKPVYSEPEDLSRLLGLDQ